MRTVIQLRLNDGNRIALALSPEYVGQPARGAMSDAVPIEARTGFGPDLLRWRHAHKPLNPDRFMCLD
jgi:hypothetical protein